MHFSVADNIKHVVRSEAYIQYRTSSHIHHGLQRIALSNVSAQQCTIAVLCGTILHSRVLLCCPLAAIGTFTYVALVQVLHRLPSTHR